MKIACLMIQKDENKFLRPWLDYHSTIFGLSNIFVYDNGSSDKDCIETLKEYELLGLNVNWDFHTQKDYVNVGYIFSEKIKELDKQESPYDFYFPIDCDEFIAYERSQGDLLLDRQSIKLELQNYIDTKHTLAINAAYDNNPVVSNSYYRSKDQRKCFFYKGTCSKLSQGYHVGKTIESNETIKTKIVYIHHHYREFHDYQFSARLKLMGVVSDFSISSLIKHKEQKVPGYHVIDKLLATEEEYYDSLYQAYNNRKSDYHALPFVSCYLEGLGIKVDAPQHIKIKIRLNSDTFGFIDSISVNKNIVNIRGWALSAKNERIQDIYILAEDGRYVLLSGIRSYPRPDVLKTITSSYLDCGIEKYFYMTKKVASIFESENISIIVTTKTAYSKLSFDGIIRRT